MRSLNLVHLVIYIDQILDIDSRHYTQEQPQHHDIAQLDTWWQPCFVT